MVNFSILKKICYFVVTCAQLNCLIVIFYAVTSDEIIKHVFENYLNHFFHCLFVASYCI